MLQEYTDEGNQKQQPIMVHRAIFGSIERFFGILIENCAGAFPLWLAPVQCRIMPVTDAVQDYAQQVAAQMREAGIRVQLDSGEMGVGCILSLACAVLQHMGTMCVFTFAGGCTLLHLQCAGVVLYIG